MLRRTLFAAAACLCLVAPGLAEPAQTLTSATMRKLPSARSHVVQHVPANAEIDVSSCDGPWCYASWRNLFGYIPAAAISADASPVAMAPPPAVVAPPVLVAPTWGWGGPYLGVGWGYGWRHW